jgi:hypothetical protein
VSGVHSFDLPAKPLKDKELQRSAARSGRRGPNAPDPRTRIEQLPLGQAATGGPDRSRWIRRTPALVAARQAWSKTTRVNQCG